MRLNSIIPEHLQKRTIYSKATTFSDITSVCYCIQMLKEVGWNAPAFSQNNNIWRKKNVFLPSIFLDLAVQKCHCRSTPLVYENLSKKILKPKPVTAREISEDLCRIVSRWPARRSGPNLFANWKVTHKQHLIAPLKLGIDTRLFLKLEERKKSCTIEQNDTLKHSAFNSNKA